MPSAESNPNDPGVAKERRTRAGASRERWWHHLVAYALLFVFWFFRVLPSFVAFAIADLLAVFLVIFTWFHERRVGPKGRGMFRNQQIVFREAWSPRLGRRLLWRWARHMTSLLVVFARLPKIQPDSFEKYVNVDEIPKLFGLDRTDGLIMVTGHMGVWEMTGHLAAVYDLDVHSVARPLGIPAVDHVINRNRGTAGQRIIAKDGALRKIRRALANGCAVGLVADEMNPQNPVFVPFLGTKAAMNPTAAKIHLATRAPILIGTVHLVSRRGPRFRLHLWEAIEWREHEDPDAAVMEISERINHAYSRAVLSYPEQWLWGSRRFQVRPPEEALGPDGLPPRAHGLDRYPPGPGCTHEWNSWC
ncbi:MAG: lysophospholipid acyltransferase family protein [Planctomycetota bacterium]